MLQINDRIHVISLFKTLTLLFKTKLCEDFSNQNTLITNTCNSMIYDFLSEGEI